MRSSADEYKDNKLLNGYDYDNQYWVINGKPLTNLKDYANNLEKLYSPLKEANIKV